MTTQNAPQARMTRVCIEAKTDADHVGCSGGYCRCGCHPPVPAARPGRFGTAPPDVVDQLARLRDARKARRQQR